MSDMNAPHSYPTGAEAVDNVLLAQLSTLQTTSTSGFERIERQMGDMVTKGEFNATITRLDAKDSQMEHTIANGFRDVDARIAEVARNAADAISTGFKSREDAAEKRTKTNRWVLGTILVGAGLVSPWLKDLLQGVWLAG